ncbi:hypothetical protein KUL118_62740 [Tenacibaculum sp. KUL118]|uniref:acyltransferase n=1 Tax=Tenacibaculum sp. XPcli2-G TaxID=2954503 RepID=UPI0012E54DAD|nr:acyltransferase [Tenacibaculum sp. XPcli2-G]MCO7186303.1 acyltransferase [Tenacibaculum sp. XPcli2-G]GFD83412.1 hypothetical protein KUL118_62740 [Tenacibaculum sp. KUL118]
MKKVIKKFFNFFLNKKKTKFKRGKRFYSNSLVDTLVPEFVEIGNNFISAPGSIILAHDSSTFLFTKKYRIEKTIIGENVFLGANSVVMPGVTIGNNVIVGAGSIVTKDVNDNAVVAGNPAKFMCTIEDYCTKCENKNVLYDVTEDMLIAYEKGERFNEKILEGFRKLVNLKAKNEV